uniref:Uncharacterized protein n=1 Tax=Arundo donax TaxID=35708 RepID=A0A0A9C0P8_ARUDO
MVLEAKVKQTFDLYMWSRPSRGRGRCSSFI